MPESAAVLSHLLLALRISLGLVFALAVVPKLLRPLTFARGVVEYRLLPAPLARVLGLALIPVEAVLAVALLAGLALDAALPATVLVLGVFLFAVGLNLRRGRRISCACFGRDSEEISPRAVVRLALLLAVSLALTAAEVSGRMPEALGSGTVGRPAFFQAAFTAFLAAFFLILGSWVLRWPELRPMLRVWHRPRRPNPPQLHGVPQ